jgi:signal transduction histidine kinase
LFGIQRLLIKADLPFEYKSEDNKIISYADFGEIHPGNVIHDINGFALSTEFEMEFLLDSKNIGDSLALNFFSGGFEKTAFVILVPYYRNYIFVIVSIIVALSFLLSAVFIVSKKTTNRDVRIIFWILVLFSLATATSPGKFYTQNNWICLVTRISHAVSYIMAIAAFLHLSFVFPEKSINKKILLPLIYIPAIAVSALLAYTIFKAFTHIDIYWITFYKKLWDVLQILLLILITAGTIILFARYRKVENEPDKRKIQWILWGNITGVSPFLVFFVLPIVAGIKPFINEEILLAFLILVPAAFAISVIKYHIFDIDMVINRSIVYFVLSVFVVLVYAGAVSAAGLLSQNVFGEYGRVIPLLATILIAFIFNPLRMRVKKTVDKVFYREKYDFEKAVSEFANLIRDCSTLTQLSTLVINEIDRLIPIKSIGFIIRNEKGERVNMIAQENFDSLSRNISALRLKELHSKFILSFADEEKIESGVQYDSSLTRVLRKWSINIVMPLTIESTESFGAFVLGDKLSGLKYSKSDLKLLKVLASQTAIAVKRLQLQEELIKKEIEKKELEELNRLKSYFVSSVSHELKTPLTSIQMFTETLLDRKIKNEHKRSEYLNIIQGESGRLMRLINNILDFSQVERGVKKYDLKPVDLKEITCYVVQLMHYQFKKNKVKTNLVLPKKGIAINADKDAVSEAVINLLSNAIKFSDKKKLIEVKLRRKNESAVLSIKDHGIGITEKELPSIFDQFYRADHNSARNIAGAGIGLALVKHIMEAHHGKVEVVSRINKGSTFSLIFPIGKEKQ